MTHREPALYALSVEPSVARPGEAVRVRFRTTNLGTTASAPAALVLTADGGLVVESGASTAVQLAPVAPGGDLVAEIAARIAADADDGARATVQAVLRLPDAELATNRCTIEVRGRAVLDGPRSGTFVERLDRDRVRVRAVVANEGDAPARDVLVVVPAPSRCVREDAPQPAVRAVDRLLPGESVDVAFDARIVAPVAQIAAGDAEIRTAGGGRAALPVRAAIVPAAELTPVLRVDAVRRGARLEIDVRNDGWAAAHDVRVEIVLPPSLQAVAGGVRVDGVPALTAAAPRPRGARRTTTAPARTTTVAPCARVETGAARLAVVLAGIAPRTAAALLVECREHEPPNADREETVAARVGEREAVAAFEPVRVRALRIVEVTHPMRSESGRQVTANVRVANAGDRDEQVSVYAERASDEQAAGAGGALVRIPAGCVAATAVSAGVPDDASDGERIVYRIAAVAGDGVAARAELVLEVRERAWLVVERDPCEQFDEGRAGGALGEGDGRRAVRYVVRNAGSTTAREVAASFGDERRTLADIAPGALAEIEIDAARARDGGVLTVRGLAAISLPAVRPAAMPSVEVRLVLGAATAAGAPFEPRVELRACSDVDEVTITLGVPDGIVAIAGSGTIDGVRLVDRDGVPALTRGLTLRGVPAGTLATLSCEAVAQPSLTGETRAFEVAVTSAGVEIARDSACVEFTASAAFARKPAHLGYHVDACALPLVAAAPVLPARPGDERVDEPGDERVDAPRVDDFDAASDDAVERPPAAIPADDPVAASEGTPGLGALAWRAHADAFSFTVVLDEERRARVARLLRAERPRLVDHLLLLGALLPGAETSGDAELASALDAVCGAVGELFDRLFVKLRIPGFSAETTDVVDAAVRAGASRLFERMQDAIPGAEAAHGPSARVDARAARSLASAIALAGDEAAPLLRALAVMLPVRCPDDAPLENALAAYAAALDTALARYDGAPRSSFENGLNCTGWFALDAARASLAAALDGGVAYAGTAHGGVAAW